MTDLCPEEIVVQICRKLYAVLKEKYVLFLIAEEEMILFVNVRKKKVVKGTSALAKESVLVRKIVKDAAIYAMIKDADRKVII